MYTEVNYITKKALKEKEKEMSKTLRMAELKKEHPRWFARGTAEIFGDKEYRILHSKQGNPYLVRRTQQWSDMFGNPLTQCWRINLIEADLKIGRLIDREFHTLSDVKEWLKNTND
jgi:hypothetical protein